MNKKEQLQEKLNIKLTAEQVELFKKYEQYFLDSNAKLNLISKNDEKVLFEKHIFDSLAINLFLKPKKGLNLLDFGTGGGFPALPIAILYPEINIFPLDSIKKKINEINAIKDKLGLKNIETICDRIENIEGEFDIITSRAVADMDKILKFAYPKLKKGGYFIAYKSSKAEEELKKAQPFIKKANLKFVKLIDYTLPLEEVYNRKLVILKK